MRHLSIELEIKSTLIISKCRICCAMGCNASSACLVTNGMLIQKDNRLLECLFTVDSGQRVVTGSYQFNDPILITYHLFLPHFGHDSYTQIDTNHINLMTRFISYVGKVHGYVTDVTM